MKEAKVKPKSVYKSLWLLSYNSICFPKGLYWLKMIPEPKIVLLHFFWWENWVVLTPNRDYHARNQIPILNQYPQSIPNLSLPVRLCVVSGRAEIFYSTSTIFSSIWTIQVALYVSKSINNHLSTKFPRFMLVYLEVLNLWILQ